MGTCVVYSCSRMQACFSRASLAAAHVAAVKEYISLPSCAYCQLQRWPGTTDTTVHCIERQQRGGRTSRRNETGPRCSYWVAEFHTYLPIVSRATPDIPRSHALQRQDANKHHAFTGCRWPHRPVRHIPNRVVWSTSVKTGAPSIETLTCRRILHVEVDCCLQIASSCSFAVIRFVGAPNEIVFFHVPPHTLPCRSAALMRYDAAPYGVRRAQTRSAWGTHIKCALAVLSYGLIRHISYSISFCEHLNIRLHGSAYYQPEARPALTILQSFERKRKEMTTVCGGRTRVSTAAQTDRSLACSRAAWIAGQLAT